MMREFNFDGLVGPTHNYAGLSYGNIASAKHFNSPSNPRAAALEGLAKMRLVAELGVPQAVLPPLIRPNFAALHNLGFRGSHHAMIEAAWKADPVLLAAVYSASSMWTANAATVSPSPDCEDGKLHFTPANLSSSLHRALETDQTTRILRFVFANPNHFEVHAPLISTHAFSDEGAANHTRLCNAWDSPGLELFTYGRVALDPTLNAPNRFPARQTREACQAIARRHQLAPERVLHLQQNPQAIDAGVFHNDVIAVGSRNVLLVHELAYLNQSTLLQYIQESFQTTYAEKLHCIEFSNHELPLEDAVSSYLFNSQLLTRPDSGMTMLCPSDCQENLAAGRSLDRLLERQTPLDDVRFINLRQSMNNGGGPACLRLRVCLDEAQAAAIHTGIVWTPELDHQLTCWVKEYYRECLNPNDLRDPKLVGETHAAQESLAKILNFPINVLLGE